MTLLIKEKTRILRAVEYKQLYNAIPKQDHKTILNALLLSGMRYVELQRLQQNTGWFDGNFIHLPKGLGEKKVVSRPIKRTSKYDNLKGFTPKQIKILKEMHQRKPRTHTGRSIHLNALGKNVIGYFVNIKTPVPTKQTWLTNLRRWAVKGNLNPDSINVKTTRKTLSSWLLATYPSCVEVITVSQGHTSTTAIKHYLSLGFTVEEKQQILEYVEGWI